MLSGAILLGPTRRESASQFYRRRIRRLAIPLLFWTFFYLCARRYLKGQLTSTMEMVGTILNGRSAPHMWFVWAILGLYAFTPILRLLLTPLPECQKLRIAVFMLATGSIAALCWTVKGGQGWIIPPNPVFVIEWVPYLGYFVLGSCLRETRISLSFLLLAIFVILITGLGGAIGIRVLEGLDQELRAEGLFECYLALPVILMSIAAFLLLSNVLRGPFFDNSLVHQLGNASFGAYLCQWAVLGAVRPIVTGKGQGHSIQSLELWIIVFVLSLLISVVCMRVPVARRFFGG